MLKTINKDFFKWVFGFLVLTIIQVNILKYFGFSIQENTEVIPDIVLVLLFFFGIHHSQIAATLTGFAAGLFLDFYSGGIVGLHALTKTGAGLLTGYAPKVYRLQKIVQFCIIFFAISILHDLLYYAIYTIDTEFSFWRLFLVDSVPSSIYSVVIGGIVFYWLKR